jgi:predicted PurR-regulated permease PerM
MSSALTFLSRNAVFWTGFLALLCAALWLLGDVLLPFVLGIAIAYLLNPVCEALCRRGFNRTVAVILVLGLFVLVALVGLALLAPVVARQLTDFAAAVPGYIDQLRNIVQPKLHDLLNQLSDADYAKLREAAGQYAGKAAQALLGVLQGIWSGGTAVFGFFALLLITPVVAFYLLRDWLVIVARVDSWLPRSKAPIIRAQLKAIDNVLAGYLRGQFMVCVVLATFYCVALLAVGLNFGIVIGLLAGLLSFIPFVGSTFGLVAAALAALVQFDGYTQLAIVVGIFMLAQFLEGNFISPKLIGESVGLHPVWIIFALMAGGSLFGFVGMLLAIPVAAVLGVLIRFGLREYLDSPYYTGGAGLVAKRRIGPI